MKARVKTTGEIVSVKVVEIGCDYKGRQIFVYEDDKRRCFADNELDFDSPDNTQEDYWTRLEHQYAGMAMQGLSEKYFKEYRDYCAGFGDMDEDEAKGAMKDFANAMADVCYYFAHALVEKLKEKE
jgi:hypothetical protein